MEATAASKVPLPQTIVICLTIFGVAIIISQTQLQEQECFQAELFGNTIGKCRGGEELAISESFSVSLGGLSTTQLDQIKDDYVNDVERDVPSKNILLELLENKIDITKNLKIIEEFSTQINDLNQEIESLKTGIPLPDSGNQTYTSLPELSTHDLFGIWEFSGTATSLQLAVVGEITFADSMQYVMKGTAGDEKFSLKGDFTLDKENLILTLNQKGKDARYYLQYNERNSFSGLNPINFEEYTFSKKV